ncbi:MAG TPA: TonB family protein [Thermodesulfovibrionia bacterium]|nr:TonB family protein [Thermodesulfovibrionia bacterium]
MRERFYSLFLSILIHITIFATFVSFEITQNLEKKEEPKLLYIELVSLEAPQPHGQKSEPQDEPILKKSDEQPVQPQSTEIVKKKAPAKKVEKKKQSEPIKKAKIVKKIPKKIERPSLKKEHEPVNEAVKKESYETNLSASADLQSKKNTDSSLSQAGADLTRKPEQTSVKRQSSETPKSTVEAKKQPVDVSFGSREGPRFLRQSMPQYPRQARRRGKEGVVVLKLFIDENGRLVNVQVVKDPGYDLAEAAVEAVKSSTFQPAKGRKGESVACRCLLPVKFVLR